ncbi:MAG: tripartite tricarboxylate transporter substrate binding protein [Rhodoferax sp.]|jgi:tripartite-type tricarboxylate transporter receptor subunit TctC|nr:tripartite tricarboxylate transporter substrate binding protein [Rhodoferax sp.]
MPSTTPPISRRTAVAALLALTLPGLARAQAAAYPSKPIHLYIASTAGGPQDVMGRMLGDELTKALGQPVVIENKPGAGGAVAAEPVMRAAPDGHTLLMTAIPYAIAPALISKLPYDMNRDFAHVAQMITGASVLVAHPSTGFRTLKDLLDAAGKNPGRIVYASAGNGTSGHLAMELLKQRAKVSMLHIPYRGGAPAVNDLLAGHAQVMIINPDIVLPHVQAGKLVALASTGRVRSPVYPGIPTVIEQGVADFESSAWGGISAPRGTPPEIVDKLNAAIVRAVQGPLRPRLEAMGYQVAASTPAEFTALFKRETENWARVVQNAGIKAD